MLKLSKLEVFYIVAEEGSFSAAAERLHLSQPAVSRHMQELEEILGIRLFKRLRRGVALTAGGEVLKSYTQKILWLVGEAEGALTDVSQLSIGQVRIGATPGVSVYLLPGWTRSFTADWQNLSVSLLTGTTSEVIENLFTARCDLGIVEGELEDISDERIEHVTLQAIDLVLVVGKDHDWWRLPQIRIEQLHDQPFITRQPGSRTRIWADQVLNARGVYPRYVAEFDNPEAIKEAVMSGVGVSILPTYAVARERAGGLLRAVPIADLTLQREIKLLYDSTRPFSAVTRTFLTHLSATFETLKPIVPPSVEGVFSNERPTP